MAPISCTMLSNPGGFLCTTDFMAERDGLELSIPFSRRRLRTLESSPDHSPDFTFWLTKR